MGYPYFFSRKNKYLECASKDLESVFFTKSCCLKKCVDFPFLLQVSSTSVMNNEVLGVVCQGSSSNHRERNVTGVSTSICTSVHIDTAGALYKIMVFFLWG